ncbi:MAG: hypothetical protein H6726_02555 [Sandaracinaceae bacterium]|nr:hypothetical protein [Myxococcales bacterium]MCB9656504.1 hypothetical protein [Sandaracinaceae bacterium]
MTRRLVPETLLALLAAACAAPLFLVEHPPIQDLPQHLAAMRVLADYDAPGLRFAEFFEVHLLRTQYLAYYGVVRVLSVALPVELANRLVLAAAIVSTPYAMRALLRALGRDERLCLLTLPLTWNAHLILGFLNFVSAIPLALLGLSLAVRLRLSFSPRVAAALAVVSTFTFYTHVVPFAFLGLGAALVLVGDGARQTLRRWLALVPAALAALLWMQVSPAGQATVQASTLAGPASEGPSPQFAAPGAALREAPMWLTDVLHGDTDIQLLVAYLVLLVLWLAAGAGGDTLDTSPDGRRRTRMLRLLGLLSPLAALLYFVAPVSYDWIWPISARFPLLALVFLLPLLPRARGAAGVGLVIAAGLLTLRSASAVGDAFEAFETEEVGALDEAVAAIPEGSRTAGLIWDRGSRHVGFSPFIHSVAWVQARRGGAVMFTFDDFPQSPVIFREDNRPPRVPPRWEWTPERVNPDTDLGFYDHVLTRGGPGRMARSSAFEEIFHDGPWRVYRRRAESGAGTTPDVDAAGAPR